MHWDRGAVALYAVALLGGVAGLFHDGFLYGCGAALLAASLVNCCYIPKEPVTGCIAMFCCLFFLPMLDWGATALFLLGGGGGALLARGQWASTSSVCALIGSGLGALVGAVVRVTCALTGKVLHWTAMGAIPAVMLGLVWLVCFLYRYGRSTPLHQKVFAFTLVLLSIRLAALAGGWADSLPVEQLAYGVVPMVSFAIGDGDGDQLLLSSFSGMLTGALLGSFSAKLWKDVNLPSVSSRLSETSVAQKE